MSSPVMRGSSKKEEAKNILKKAPILVLFFMDGCPHCDANMPHWDKMVSKHPEISSVKIEASATPDNSGVSGFPTMEYHGENGSVKRISGEKESPEAIESELGLKKGGRRRRTRRARNTRRRKLGNRSLRRNIPLIK